MQFTVSDVIDAGRELGYVPARGATMFEEVRGAKKYIDRRANELASYCEKYAGIGAMGGDLDVARDERDYLYAISAAAERPGQLATTRGNGSISRNQIIDRASEILGDSREPDALADAVSIICQDAPRSEWKRIRTIVEELFSTSAVND